MGFGIEEFPFTSEYDSDLRAVLKYIREVVTKIKNYDDVIAQLEEALEGIGDMDARITALENATADLEQIRASINTIESEITSINSQHSADISRLQREIDEVRGYIRDFDNQIEAARAYSLYLYTLAKSEWKQDIATITFDVHRQLIELQNDVKLLYSIIESIDTSLTNPWHTELGRIGPSENNGLVYADLADECLTANQYLRLGYTADQYSAFNISAIDYARFGKTLLHYFWVYSPAFGFKQEISNVLTSIMNTILDTLTATEYTALDLDADTYTALDLTAYQYYSYMADEGFLRLDREGITASQYSTLGV